MWKILFLALFISNIFAHSIGILENFSLGEECDSDEDCEDIPNAICNSAYECECTEGYLGSLNNSTCLPLANKIGDECEISEQCSTIPSAECISNSCVVAQAVVNFSSVIKPKDGYTEHSQCTNTSHICKNGISVLSEVVPKVNSSEKPIIGMYCSNDTDCHLEGTVCVEKFCRCQENFVTSQNLKICLPKAKSIGDNCNETAQCIFLNNSICENQKCSQKMASIVDSFEGKLPPLLIGSTCQNNDQCKHLPQAVCLENICQCEENYITSVLSNSCLAKAKKEGDECEIDKQCEGIKGAFCNKNKCVKPAVADTRMGSGSCRFSTGVSTLVAAILFIKICFV